MTRLEAAERAVVEAAMAWCTWPPEKLPAVRALALDESCARLRDLRERVQAEECAEPIVVRCVAGPSITRGTVDTDRVPQCTLPRGHEGEHVGELGEWRWA